MSRGLGTSPGNSPATYLHDGISFELVPSSSPTSLSLTPIGTALDDFLLHFFCFCFFSFPLSLFPLSLTQQLSVKWVLGQLDGHVHEGVRSRQNIRERRP